MTPSQNSAAASRAKKPYRFFEKQLPGEAPVSFETAGQLYQLAMAFLALEPWNFLADEDLILMKDSESGEICYFSIMGALGEVFSFQVYVGAESFRLFRRISSGKPLTAGDFFASLRGVSAEFVTASELTPPDRALLQAFGHPNKRGKRSPKFRAARPGYHPWYLTETEARLLMGCLQGALAFCRHESLDLETECSDYWEQEDVFPFLAPNPEDKTGKRFKLRLVQAPEPPLAAPQPAELDERLMAELLRADLPQQGSLEADYFCTGARIGEGTSRQAALHMAIVADGDSGYAFQPELGEPGDSAGKLLAGALLGAMRSARCVPREVRVRRNEFKILLSTLSERLGFAVRVTQSTPALNELKRHFLKMIGDPGEISPQ
jgi:hypothetical protein